MCFGWFKKEVSKQVCDEFEQKERQSLYVDLEREFPGMVRSDLSVSVRTLPSGEVYMMDVRGFFMNPNTLKSLVADNAKFLKNYLDALNFVKCTMTYAKDSDTFGISDYWALPPEVLTTLRGDCDDGAILLANILSAMGYPGHRIFLAVGLSASNVGHMIVIFHDGSKFMTLDWSANGLKHIWFMWNNDACWGFEDLVNEAETEAVE